MNLVEAFSEIEDFRRPQGRRYPLAPMLMLTKHDGIGLYKLKLVSNSDFR